MIKVRHVVFGELAVAAVAVNNAAYNLAIWANRFQGWLVRHRDLRDVPGRSAVARR
jgi:hypothetical protein